ncbi:MAG: hypothetical protein FH749_05505 [Firmicutes bacterium]|nr:hypothetical protein [Bacillota bacterium]
MDYWTCRISGSIGGILVKKLIIALVIIAVIAISPQAMAFFGTSYIIAEDTISTHPGHVLFYITLGNNEDTYQRQDGSGPVGFHNHNGDFVVDFGNHENSKGKESFLLGEIVNKSNSAITVTFNIDNPNSLMKNNMLTDLTGNNRIQPGDSGNIEAEFQFKNKEIGLFSTNVTLSVALEGNTIGTYEFPVQINVVESYPQWDSVTIYEEDDYVIHDGRIFWARWYIQGIEPGTDPVWQEVTDEWRWYNVYGEGDIVVFEGKEFRARGYSQNDQPGLMRSPWNELTDEWRSFNVYNNGDIVWYNGQQYRAGWYTQNDPPDASHVWEVLP